jgi:hypothetical protein
MRRVSLNEPYFDGSKFPKEIGIKWWSYDLILYLISPRGTRTSTLDEEI